MPGLVLFLHGLGGDKNSWGAVPDFVRDSALGNNFDIATPEYSATLRSPSTIETSAQQILTLIQTKYPDHDPIFIVGHSLGGLVARELSRHLLLSGPDELLNKIPAVVTLGTPLEGARIGNPLLRYVPIISPKIRQLTTPKYAFDDYRHAAGFGSIFLPMKSQRTVKWNSNKRPPRKLLDKSDMDEIESCECPVCIGKSIDQRIHAFRRHFYDRSIHNAWTLVNQSRYWPRSRAKLRSAISNGALGSSWASAMNSAI